MKKIFKAMILFIFTVCFTQNLNAQNKSGPGYKVGIDDVLEISIIQPEKLTTTVNVSPDGSIAFPYIGNVPVKDMTLDEIKNDIERRLCEGYMKYPLISVFLRDSRSRKFYVSGDVGKPGVYPLEDDTTVLKALSIAEGFTKKASSGKVKILRAKRSGEGQEFIDVDIKALMKGDANEDIKLLPGDTVIVSEGKFFVYGEVNSPGVYTMENNITVLKAIAIAGGFSKYGSSSKVKILRPREDGSGYETIKVNIKDIMSGDSDADISLRIEDTVVVMEGMF